MDDKIVTKVSKFLSFVLRHKPEAIGVELDANGWADVDALIEKSNKANIPLTPELLQHIVETNSKKRFAFNEQQNKIRASQGHSIEIELELNAVEPPAVLYHGTAESFVGSILEKGLLKQQRQHVHLSTDVETAVKVGQRHGKPKVFEVLAKQMHTEGHKFYLSANGVWLVDEVPPAFLRTT
ncbi:MAG TPA: RNA 2'-phosphotransferase [Chitinophagaceae bacterium]|nr:RNA 2'-phosphotransferase [Chitinophagaceae bacterium]